jgi:hypothetical protein
VICKGCGTQFESHQSSRIYCCKLCWFLLKSASLSFTTGVLGTCQHCKSLLTREAYDSGVSVPDFLNEHEACRRALLDRGGRPDDCRCRECKKRKEITTALSVPPSARKRGARTHQKHREVVLERDEYMCQICFLPTDADARVQDDRYPTLDHILSVALGGDDEPDNLRTAHRWCNIMVGDAGLVNDELVRDAAQRKFRE